MLFRVIISTIGGLQTFTAPRVRVGSSGGTGQSGLTTFLYLYKRAFGANDYGDAAAVALSIFMLVLLFTAINWRLFRGRGTGARNELAQREAGRSAAACVARAGGVALPVPVLLDVGDGNQHHGDIYRFPPKFTFGSQFDDNVRQVLAK